MALAPKSVFITGANRGIGLEFVKQLVQLPTPPKYIFATCRNPDAATVGFSLAGADPNTHFIYWVRNEVAMRENLMLPLEHIGACVDVHTISSIAKYYKYQGHAVS